MLMRQRASINRYHCFSDFDADEFATDHCRLASGVVGDKLCLVED